MGATGEMKKDNRGIITVVLKVDMHCEGCAKKILNSIKLFQGVEHVKGDLNANIITVTGNVDPVRLREEVEIKWKKKVELIFPCPTKQNTDNKPLVRTVVVKTQLHCGGCSQKIRKKIFEITGVEIVTMDLDEELVTVKGTMDVKALPSLMSDKLKQKVDIVSPRNDTGDGGDESYGYGYGYGYMVPERLLHR